MTGARDSRGSGEPVSIEGWLTELAALLPPGLLDEVGPPERAVLLDLARIAAHRSHRTAAPISTYLVGLALASTARPERLARMRELASRLDTEA